MEERSQLTEQHAAALRTIDERQKTTEKTMTDIHTLLKGQSQLMEQHTAALKTIDERQSALEKTSFEMSALLKSLDERIGTKSDFAKNILGYPEQANSDARTRGLARLYKDTSAGVREERLQTPSKRRSNSRGGYSSLSGETSGDVMEQLRRSSFASSPNRSGALSIRGRSGMPGYPTSRPQPSTTSSMSVPPEGLQPLQISIASVDHVIKSVLWPEITQKIIRDLFAILRSEDSFRETLLASADVGTPRRLISLFVAYPDYSWSLQNHATNVPCKDCVASGMQCLKLVGLDELLLLNPRSEQKAIQEAFDLKTRIAG